MAGPDDSMALEETVSHFLSGEAEAAKRKPAARQGPAPDSVQQPPLTEDQVDAALAKEEARRAAIRETLLEQARKDYPAQLGNVQTGYSADLEGLRRDVNAYLRSEGNRFHSHVAIIDPAKLDTGMAIGLSASSAVTSILSAQGVHPDKATVDDAASKATAGFATKFGAMTYTQDPTAFTNAKGPIEACVIVPSSDHAILEDVNIKGLSAQDRVKFLDRHESWHCIDDQYTLRHIDEKELAKVNLNDLKSVAANPTACEAIAIKYQKEAFADAGAVGSMIREGYGLALLDNISDWRKNRPGDLIHNTTPVLDGMKQEIRDMGGVEKFRQLSEAQAKEFYYKVVDKYGITGKSFQVALQYETANPLQRLGHQIDATVDNDVRKGLELRDYTNRKPDLVANPTLSSAEYDQLQKYDAQAQLEQRAFQIGRKVTPATMVQAYTQLQEDLRAQMKAHPESQIYAEQMTKLQRDFTTNVKTMDYVEANSRFGVKIENVEPSLAAFSDKHPAKPRQPATKP
ncbi:MAG: hypothetical protein EPN97_07725 [Alphaproteobacteria bacterium]|nr:MAG: hypothetical protein EPN97_07725 [Alphaproteobacteria bacterium]